MTFIPVRDFDAELDAERREQQRRRDAVHTAADLDEAVGRAFAAGRAEGRAEGEAVGRAQSLETAAERTLAALEAVAPAVGRLLGEADRHRAALEAQVVEFTLAVFDRILPELVRSRAGARAEAEIHHAATLALGSARLGLRLPPDVAQTAGPDLTRRLREAGFEGRVEIVADAALAGGDIRADWDNGFLDYSYAAICNRIIGALNAAAPDQSAARSKRKDEERTANEQ